MNVVERKILIRFDDVCPTMNWEQWDKAMQLLSSAYVTALLGVIPDCKDPDLQIDAYRKDFWEYIKQLQQQGFTIAMHGYNHTFSITADGIVTKNKISEFAGLPYEEQLDKIRKGKAIFKKHGIETDVFFAPAHSYDDNTLRALSECGFKYISDGFSARPYIRQGITCIPCPAGNIPEISGNGYYTAVIHAHEWTRSEKANEWIKLQQLIANHHNNIVSFEEYSIQKIGCAPYQRTIEQLCSLNKRYVIPILVKIKHTVF